jgi:hypothetical protein
MDSRGRLSLQVLSSVSGDPDLVGDDCHHEYKVEAEGPEEHELWGFEVAAGDRMFFGLDELIGFEGGEDPGLIGGERGFVEFFCHSCSC